jgi:Putative beta-barrel porin 2
MYRGRAAVTSRSHAHPRAEGQIQEGLCTRAMFIGKVVGVSLCGMLCMPSNSYAQRSTVPVDPPESAPVRLGPVALAPSLAVTNLGWDSNIFAQPDAEAVGDFTATTTPRVLGWMRLGRARVRGRAAVNLVYFQDHPDQRSVDEDYEGRFDLVLTRLTPYMSTTWVSARQPTGFEVDQRVRRHEKSFTAGVGIEMGPRTNLDLGVRRRRAEFSDQGDFQDPLVSEFDDYTSQGVSASFGHDLTPFTSFVVTADGHEDRFDGAPDRDTDNVGIGSGVEFRPHAMISGHAYVGWLRMQMVNGDSPPFGGLTAAMDLAYTLLGATRFSLQAERDVQYSAVRNQEAYLQAGLTASVNHRFNETWDAGARIGRFHLTYGLFEGTGAPGVPGPQSSGYAEDITQYGGQLGYRIGPQMRLAFVLHQQQRDSELGTTRGYSRTVAGMSVNYAF